MNKNKTCSRCEKPVLVIGLCKYHIEEFAETVSGAKPGQKLWRVISGQWVLLTVRKVEGLNICEYGNWSRRGFGEYMTEKQRLELMAKKENK